MGTVASMCGFGPAIDHSDPHLEFLRDDKTLSASERSRAHSGGTDSSVASILSNADSLIPEAFQPVDIQVLSRGRRRSGVHHLSGSSTPGKTVSQSSLNSGPPLSQRYAISSSDYLSVNGGDGER